MYTDNKKLKDFKRDITGKKVAFLGIGVSNTPAVKYLVSLGAKVAAFDKAGPEKIGRFLEGLSEIDVELHLGNDYLSCLTGYDYIFRTPVIRPDLPEIRQAIAEGAVLTSEIELFMALCPAKIIGVTGSDGKTTTSTIIHRILERAGFRCWLGGNIGVPLLDRVEEIKAEDKAVLELSSFQLMTMRQSPDIAVITNISPNHLDIHKSMEEYVEAKKNIFRFQNPKQRIILNYDDRITGAFAAECTGKPVFFSMNGSISAEEACVLKDNGCLTMIHEGKETKMLHRGNILIKGSHNIQNYLCAIAATACMAGPGEIADVAAAFPGVEHRNEFVAQVHGVKYYNDSIGTSPTRTIATLNSFDDKVILIAGGYDKNLSYESLGEAIAEKVKCLVLAGDTSRRIRDSYYAFMSRAGAAGPYGGYIPVFMCDSLESAVKKAVNAASEGDNVLLSPASASFDMFRNFEEKGNRYKELVKACIQKEDGQ
ncbi:MAG: UDP-N-acetylmuramoyl-L-alanine--D-glutamate ligase [Eubacteriales bacterium]|nr:UDP-N-acetylmuramoyl-L-alanine--D-glutamate ligase [Eubacteriales bacterium]